MASGTGPRSQIANVNALAIAIAHAEGFYVPGSRPARNHNPGDISDTYLSNGKDGPLSTFPDDQTGWDALTFKLDNIVNGNSTVYPTGASIAQLAQTWTGGDNPGSWANNVISSLNSQGVTVDDSTTLGDFNG